MEELILEDSMFEMFEFTPNMVAAGIGLLVPVLVSFLHKLDAPNVVKVLLNLALTAVAGVVGTLVGGDGSFAWNAFGGAWLVAFVTSVSSYYGAYKPAAVTENIVLATPNFGFGPKSEPVLDLPPDELEA
jgi:hypothetical protein